MVTDQLNHLNTRLAKLGHHIDQLKPAKNWFRHVFPVSMGFISLSSLPDKKTGRFKVYLMCFPFMVMSHTETLLKNGKKHDKKIEPHGT